MKGMEGMNEHYGSSITAITFSEDCKWEFYGYMHSGIQESKSSGENAILILLYIHF